MDLRILFLPVMFWILTSCASVSPIISATNDTDYSVTPVTPALIAQLQGEQAQKPGSAIPVDDSTYTYRLGVGDVLLARLYNRSTGSDDLTLKDFTTTDITLEGYESVIKYNGYASLPYVGEVYFEGKTLQEARQALNAGLKTYFKDPQAALEIKEFHSRKVQITGEVHKPGEQYLQFTPLHVIEAVGAAGGTQDDADLAGAVITHKNGQAQKIDLFALLNYGDASQNFVLLDGDTLNIPVNQGNKVFVMGEVSKPSSLYIRGGRMTVTEALNTSQGLDPNTASYKEIYVIRSTMGSNTSSSPVSGAINTINTPSVTPSLGVSNNVSTSSPVSTFSTPSVLAASFLSANREVSVPPVATSDVSNNVSAPSISTPPTPTVQATSTEIDAHPMQTTIYHIDGSSGIGLAMASQFPLKPNDVVYVSPTAISEWSKIVSQILPEHGVSVSAVRAYNINGK